MRVAEPTTPKMSRDTWRTMRIASDAVAALRSACGNMHVARACEDLAKEVARLRRAVKPSTEPVQTRTYTVELVRDDLQAQGTGTSRREALESARVALRSLRSQRREVHNTIQASTVARIVRNGLVCRHHDITRRLASANVSDQRVNMVHLTPGWFGRALHDVHVFRINEAKSPKDDARYVGVEIECHTSATREKLAEAMIEAGLMTNVSLISDGSVQNGPAGFTPIEVRVLAMESARADVIRRTTATIAKFDGDANDTCGLHVHIDCRNRDASTVYARLVHAQKLLAAMVPRRRRENTYCKPNVGSSMNSNQGDRYLAINPCAYDKHRTIEVRLHSGTVDPEKIIFWLDLLLAIVDGPDMSVFPQSLAAIAEKLSLSAELVAYIETRVRKFNASASPIPFVEPRTRVRRTRATVAATGSERGGAAPTPQVDPADDDPEWVVIEETAREMSRSVLYDPVADYSEACICASCAVERRRRRSLTVTSTPSQTTTVAASL